MTPKTPTRRGVRSPRPPRTLLPGSVTGPATLGGIDLIVALAVLVGLYLLLHVGRGADVRLEPHHTLAVSDDPSRLPYDAVRSLLRMFIALALSVAFTFVYAYAAARSRRLERVLIPLLDVLQSVPVLGFLSVTVTAFIALFPDNELGLEAASIFAIFTSQAWNLTFSFYGSLKSVPGELDELSQMLRLTRWQRFWKIEVPHAAIGLVWNGMMSFGGAWFFLAASEAITVLGHDEALPGVGSYVAEAVSTGDLAAVGWAILAMAIMVVAVNIMFWRPLIAFAERYRYEGSAVGAAPRSALLSLLRHSDWPRLLGRARRAAAEPLARAMSVLGRDGVGTIAPVHARRRRAGDLAFSAAVIVAIAVGTDRLAVYIVHGVGASGVGRVFALGAYTLARVLVLLLIATAVWVPIGVWIGLDDRVSRYAQPVVQILASFPANFLFPFATYLFLHLGLSLNIGGVLLMALGAQWYILFNVIAGASAIPGDLREAMTMMDAPRRLRWRVLILPAIAPAFATGAITAAGGAWNASIVAEVVTFGSHTLIAAGLGSYITLASEHGQFPRILLGVAVMSIYVVALNRLFWRRLYDHATTRYSL